MDIYPAATTNPQISAANNPRRRKKMVEMKAEAAQSALENALSDLVRRAVRAEIQEIVRL